MCMRRDGRSASLVGADSPEGRRFNDPGRTGHHAPTRHTAQRTRSETLYGSASIARALDARRATKLRQPDRRARERFTAQTAAGPLALLSVPGPCGALLRVAKPYSFVCTRSAVTLLSVRARLASFLQTHLSDGGSVRAVDRAVEDGR